MAVEKKKQTYLCRGREFDTEDAAKRFDKIEECRIAMETAQRSFQRALGENAKTKDGVLFVFSAFRDYFIVIETMSGPVLRSVSFFPFTWEMAERVGEDGSVRVAIRSKSEKSEFVCYVDELYSSEKLAREVYRNARLGWYMKKIEDLKKSDFAE